MIEDQLRETFGRVAAGRPEEAGAFDRFLRRRARRGRTAAGAAGLALVLALGSVVAVADLVRSGRAPTAAPEGRGPRLLAAGEPVDRRFIPGPLVAAAPNQGFEVSVPAGWEARPTWKGFELRSASPSLRRRLARPVELDTTYLEAFYQPGGREQYQDGSQLPEAARPRTPAGPGLARGRFPGGRAWFRTEGRVGASPTDWYVSWPYHCAGGRSCPEVLTLRALHVAYRAEREAVAETAALAERLLSSARPTGNAVAGRAHAPRPACWTGGRWGPSGWSTASGPSAAGGRRGPSSSGASAPPGS
jgi:hypothetical protein